MKVGIFSPYLETMGGGERYLLTVAEFFCHRGDQVDIFWSKDRDLAKIKDRFNLDLAGVNFQDNIFDGKMNLLGRLVPTMNYDLMFFLSDGSIPSSLAKKNILHFQRPFRFADQKTWLNKIKLSRFSAIVCNSKFTKKDVDKTYGVNSLVLYPPVDVNRFFPGKKKKIILSVGRFFAPSPPKKQELMVKTFIQMVKSGLKDWEMILLGGVTGKSIPVVKKLESSAKGYPVTVIADSNFSRLQSYYSQAKIFWHAAGFGEDLEKYPERAEHFGITTVEAMAAGCIPIVFAGGGQKEIITEGKNGFFWKTTGQLIAKTLKIARDEKLRQQISQKAVVRSKYFSKEKFFQHLNEIL